MKIFSWNCRGLGRPATVRALRGFINKISPSIVFLMETKCNHNRVEEVRRRLNFHFAASFDAVGLSGGLAVLWKNDVNIVVERVSRYFIHLKCSSLDNYI